MPPKKPKVKPADKFIEDNVDAAAAAAAAVDAVTPEVSQPTKKDDVKTRRLTVRINEGLYEKLWAARGVGERSMVAIVTAALEKHLEGK